MKPLIFALLSMVIVINGSAMAAAETKQCFAGGKFVHLSQGQGYSQTKVSADKTFALVDGNYQGDSFNILNLKTKALTEFKKPVGSSVTLVEGNQLAYTKIEGIDVSSAPAAFKGLRNAKTILIDPKTGARSEIAGKVAISGALLKPLRAEGDQTLVLGDDRGNETKINVSPGESRGPIHRRYAEDLREPEVTFNSQTKTLLIEKNGKRLFSNKVEMASSYVGGAFSPDAKYFVSALSQSTNEALVVNLKTGKHNVFPLPANYSAGTVVTKGFAKDSSRLILYSHMSPSAGVMLMDLETGKVSVLNKEQGSDAEFSEDGQRICYRMGSWDQPASRHCADAKSGEVVARIPMPMKSGNFASITERDFVVSTWGSGGQESQSYLFSHENVCAESVPVVECNCLVPNIGSTVIDLSNVKKVALGLACSKKFDASDWKNLVDTKATSLTEETAVLALKKFAKPGGFDPKRDMGVLQGLINAELHKKYSSEFRAALAGVLVNSNVLYESIISGNPELQKLTAKPDTSCLVESEKEAVRNAVRDYTKTRILGERRPKFSDLVTLTNLAKEVLLPEQRETLAELAADQLVFSAGDSAELNQIFPSKVYKFAEAKMKAVLDLPFKELTDITVVRDGGKLKYIQLGVSPTTASSKPTVAGFYQTELKSVDVSSLPDAKSVERFAWSHAGKSYTAEIGLNKQKLEREIVSTAKSPNYAAMWKDKTFRGVVIAGSNMGSGITDAMMKEYIEYYTEQGFKFAEPVVHEDIPKYLEAKVSGKAPMHYFVKEAHSDGDEKNLFRLSKKGKVLVGTRTAGGTTEIIDLVYPTADSKSELVSNQDFGKWIQAREKTGGPELVYLNSSCWSKTKATFEISAAASPTLINIPTTTLMYTFTNSEKNVMHATIDGLRKRKSYAEIREAMKKNDKYQSKNGNVFIFPDEDEYKKQVTDVIKVPIDVHTRLFVKKDDGTLGEYSIEAMN